MNMITGAVILLINVIINTLFFIGFNHRQAENGQVAANATIDQAIHPQYGHCGKCGLTWATVEGHSTRYTESEGMFPLCEKCWSELTPEQRLPYYRSLWESWEREIPGHANWNDIEKAVLEGK